MEGLDDDAPVSRSAPQHQSPLGYRMTSLGSIEQMSQSPPAHFHHQPQQHDRRRKQSPSTSVFFSYRENVDDVRQDSPPHASDRQFVLAPPPYSRRDAGDDVSPTRPRQFLLSSGSDDSQSPPLMSPGAATRSPSRHPPRSPRLIALRRNAASDNSVLLLYIKTRCGILTIRISVIHHYCHKNLFIDTD